MRNSANRCDETFPLVPAPRAYKRLRLMAACALFSVSFIAGFVLAAPPAEADDGAAKARLAGVERWLLLLNNELDSGTVERIAASDYDMVVVDDIATLSWNAGLDMRATVERLKSRPVGQTNRRRLAISYLNIGQAEDYRVYFPESWKTAPPHWIVGADPEGWAGNYPVAYWHPEWQAILNGPEGLARQIAREGFDGAYLDWAAGYHDESVKARARQDGVDARVEMIRLIVRVGEAARSINPDFVLIVQNTSDLAYVPEIIEAADAFVQEAIWFDGTVGDDPPGDCALPRTAAEAGSRAYLASLPAPCARAYADGRAGILDFAAEQWLVPDLTRARAAGLAVFTVDYAVQPANVSEAVRRSRALGFKPFVGARSLKEFQPPLF